jgi:hypothetical protein
MCWKLAAIMLTAHRAISGVLFGRRPIPPDIKSRTQVGITASRTPGVVKENAGCDVSAPKSGVERNSRKSGRVNGNMVKSGH